MRQPIIGLSHIDHPRLGRVWAAAGPNGLARVEFGLDLAPITSKLEALGFMVDPGGTSESLQAADEIGEYLIGSRRQFSLPIDWSHLRPFQIAALQAYCAIPYGEVRTYAQIAAQIGRPNAPRAVGQAGATNPMPLVVPCHRVLGTDGKLHGYGGPGGIPTKAWLLEMERRYSE
jgi:methylated-DNA-[protein]-cysteine S-methyltransferase